MKMGYKDLMFDKNARFLVTGGAGFIGSNLCQAILDLGYKVRCLVDRDGNSVRKNILHLQDNPNFEITECDIRSYEDCLGACQGADFILHHAACGSPRVDMPLLYEEVNVKGTLNMMEAARRTGVEKFVYASSASVYGDDSSSFKREDIVGNIISQYALTKRINEDYGRLYHGLYGLDTYGLRYFNVFGKRQDVNSGFIIPRFIMNLLSGERTVLYGDGTQSRDFVYIDDIVQANLRACAAPSEAGGQVYNVAYGEGRQLLDIYRHISALLKKDIEPVFGSEHGSDVKHSRADISKAGRLLGYAPEWSFERGIEETVKWYENIKS